MKNKFVGVVQNNALELAAILGMSSFLLGLQNSCTSKTDESKVHSDTKNTAESLEL